MQVGSVPAIPGSNETGGNHRTLPGSPGYARDHSRSGRTSLARPRAPHRAARAMRDKGCSRAPNTTAVTEPCEFTFGAASVYKIQKTIAKTSYGRDGGAAPPGAGRSEGTARPRARAAAVPRRPQSRSRVRWARATREPRGTLCPPPVVRGDLGKEPRGPHLTAPRAGNRSAPDAGCWRCPGPLPAGNGPQTSREARRPRGPVATGGSPLRVHGLDGSRRKRAGTGSTERTRNGHVSAVQRRSRARTGAGSMCGGTPSVPFHPFP